MAISRILSDGVANTAISRIDGDLGIGTASPDGKLHVHTASAGSIAAVSTSDDLVVENSDHGGMSILTPDDKYGIVAFGSPSDGHGFLVDWYHAGNAGRVHTSKVGAKLELKADNSVVGLTLDGAAGSQFAEFANDIGLKSDNSIIYFGADNDIRLTHVPDTGLRLNDSMKMLFGTGSDLEIFHDGSNSYINDAGTGSLIVKASQFLLRNAAGSENMFDATQDGAVNLYYDNSAKITTTSTGSTVNGMLHVAQAAGTLPSSSTNVVVIQKNSSTTDNAVVSLIGGAAGDSRVEFGDAADRDIGMIRYTHSDNGMEFWTNTSEKMFLTSAGNLGIGSTQANALLHLTGGTDQKLILSGSGSPNINLNSSTGDDMLVQNHAGDFRIYNLTDSREDFSVTGAGQVKLWYAASRRLETESYGISLHAKDTRLPWSSGDDNHYTRMYYDSAYHMGLQYLADARDLVLYTKSGDNAGDIRFKTGTNATERMVITADGPVGIGTTSVFANSVLEVFSATNVIPTATTTSDNHVAAWRSRRTAGSHQQEWYSGLRNGGRHFDFFNNTDNSLAGRFTASAQGSSNFTVYGAVFGQNGSGNAVYGIDGGTGQIWIGGGNANTTNINFQITSTAYAMRLDANSNLGIGTSSPEARLDVVGDKVMRSTGSNTSGRLWQYVRAVGDNPSTANIAVFTMPNYATAVVKVRVTGRGTSALTTQHYSEQTYVCSTDTSSVSVQAGTQVDIDTAFTLAVSTSSQQVTINVSGSNVGGVNAYVEVLSNVAVADNL